MTPTRSFAPRALPRRPKLAWIAAALPLLAACSDRGITLPAVPAAPAPIAAALCTVSVAEQSMVCTDAQRSPASGARADKILGGQEVYVRLTSSGTSYDGGTEILSTNVTVQNLLRQTMGVDSTAAVVGVRVFFQQNPTVTVGSGEVTLVNPDATDGTFTATNQPYYLYNQAITPYEISAARNWLFNVPPTATKFVFTVYVSAPLASYTGTLLDHVWTGATSSDWSTAGNWNLGTVPDSGSTVSIPADSLLASHTMPVLSADVALTNLRVGYGSTLGLSGHTLVAWGNVDGVGTVSGGTVWSRGTAALLGGNLASVQVSGSAALQKSTVTSGAVSVTGTLAVKDQALSIQIP
ncbi:MAG TPA: hypothetical protein VFJ16_08065 [Longimicrobium sp.]|nr:hypothetical protein [Longimicrobium sp.]